MKVFLSYCFDDTVFVQRVNYHLRKQSVLQTYCYSDARPAGGWSIDVGRNLGESDVLVLFVGSRLGEGQHDEIRAVLENRPELARQGIEYRVVKVVLPGAVALPKDYTLLNPVATVEARATDEAGALDCARRLATILIGRWTDDDLPIGYPFDYEKDIIAEYGKGALSPERIAQGCPPEWPRVVKRSGTIENRVDTKEIGLYRDWDYQSKKPRDEDPQVVVAALADFHTDALVSRRLTFPEAGPRKYLAYPNSGSGGLTVGVMVSGGIAPGINSVIAGIVERQFLYAERGGYKRRLTVRGYRNGLSALFRQGTHHQPLSPEDVRSQANLGGSMLGTSRAHEFMTNDPVKIEEALVRAVTRLEQQGTEILYIIGGDGSMRAAHSLWKKAQDMGKKLSVVGIPKTMDNDILWVWQSFGFLSAVEWSKECIQQLHTEAQSNPRLCVIQLFGSDSGFVVTHAVTASGDCDLFLVPEVPFTMKRVADYVTQKLKERYDDSGLESAYGLVVMAETAIPLDAKDYMDDEDVNLTEKEKDEIRSFLVKRRIFGQTPDELRSGGLKLVSRVLQRRIREMGGDYWPDFRVFANEPRHLIRSIPPSSSDIIFGHRLGSLAVDCAMAGYTDFMISQWLTEYVMVPLRLVNLGRKRIPQDGIFYKSARASTGQPASLAG